MILIIRMYLTPSFTKHWNLRFKNSALGNDEVQRLPSSYFVKEHSDSLSTYIEESIMMPSFLIDTIYTVLQEMISKRYPAFQWEPIVPLT